jgi:hypothetical protein
MKAINKLKKKKKFEDESRWSEEYNLVVHKKIRGNIQF